MKHHKKRKSKANHSHNSVKRSESLVPRGFQRSRRKDKGRFPIRMVAAFITGVVLILIAVGVATHRNDQQEAYWKNYVIALYGLNSGMSMVHKVADGTYSEWKEGLPSEGVPFSRNHMEIRTDLDVVKLEIEKVLKEMGPTPAGFDEAGRILNRLYVIYEKSYTTVLKSPDLVSPRYDKVAAFEKEFDGEIQYLKARIPAPLAEQLRKTGRKYDLSFMSAK